MHLKNPPILGRIEWTTHIAKEKDERELGKKAQFYVCHGLGVKLIRFATDKTILTFSSTTTNTVLSLSLFLSNSAEIVTYILNAPDGVKILFFLLLTLTETKQQQQE